MSLLKHIAQLLASNEGLESATTDLVVFLSNPTNWRMNNKGRLLTPNLVEAWPIINDHPVDDETKKLLYNGLFYPNGPLAQKYPQIQSRLNDARAKARKTATEDPTVSGLRKQLQLQKKVAVLHPAQQQTFLKLAAAGWRLQNCDHSMEENETDTPEDFPHTPKPHSPTWDPDEMIYMYKPGWEQELFTSISTNGLCDDPTQRNFSRRLTPEEVLLEARRYVRSMGGE